MPKTTKIALAAFITFSMVPIIGGVMGFINAGSALLAHWPASFITA
jgi:uncharacterized membrane protein (UPF0136 family)